MDVKIETSWKEVLKDEFKKPYFKQIADHLKTEKAQGKTIYPPGPQIFHAFEATPFDELKVVILGQDPYHGPKRLLRLMMRLIRVLLVLPIFPNDHDWV